MESQNNKYASIIFFKILNSIKKSNGSSNEMKKLYHLLKYNNYVIRVLIPCMNYKIK